LKTTATDEGPEETEETMECRYCQAVNAEDDHRCTRCGRRLRMTPIYNSSSAAAPALAYESEPRATPKTANRAVATAEPATTQPPTQPSALPPLTRKPITYQPSLFSSRELPRVVQFETIAPASLEPPVRKTVVSKPRARHRRVIPGQQSLEFAPTAGMGRSNRPAEGTIYCDAPVAVAPHRAMAAALDASMIVMALGVFGGIYYFAGGPVALNSKSLPLVLGIVAVVTLFYKLLWCLADGDSPGQKWTRLTLVNFDGQKPNRTQRFQRMASGFLSLFAAGLGLLWALVDEETLTWHDHISRTFPTPY
jgi:uncharacterized RDD family membrane protein YckC